MKDAALTLQKEMLSALEAAPMHEENELQTILQCIHIISDAISKLKALLESQAFASEEEEIHFFKKIKPEFDSRLIYYLRLLSIEQLLPMSGTDDKKEYYRQELQKIRNYYEQNREFYSYCQLGQTHLDSYYFLRHSRVPEVIADDYFLIYDHRYNTLMSSKLAAIKAYQLLQQHIDHRLWSLSNEHSGARSETIPPLTWTATKAALGELVVALQEFGVFNNTKVETKKIADYFAAVFNVDLKNIYKIYEDIRLRKKSRTPFLDSLRNGLLRRMELDDENAL